MYLFIKGQKYRNIYPNVNFKCGILLIKAGSTNQKYFETVKFSEQISKGVITSLLPAFTGTNVNRKFNMTVLDFKLIIFGIHSQILFNRRTAEYNRHCMVVKDHTW